MKSTYLLAGAAVAVVLSAATVISVALEQWVVAATSAVLLLSATFLVSLDADRRVRALRPYVRGEVSRVSAALAASEQDKNAAAPPVSDRDVIGAVRVLQAQYTGRLDRMQDSVEQAIADLRRSGGADSEASASGSPRTGERT